MLRVHCVQLFYNLSDAGMEDLLYEVESVRRFVGLRLSGPLPDETTILNFRHLLEKHGLGGTLFEEINAHLASLRNPVKVVTRSTGEDHVVARRVLGKRRVDMLNRRALGLDAGGGPGQNAWRQPARRARLGSAAARCPGSRVHTAPRRSSPASFHRRCQRAATSI